MDRFEPPAAAAGSGGVGIGLAVEDWTGDARFHEYSAAVDPIGSGLTSAVPIRRFPAQPRDPGSTQVVVLDLSDALGTPYPATGPSLLARFVCIAEGHSLDLAPKATSVLFYCLGGSGYSEVEGPGGTGRVTWRAGDVVTLPGTAAARHHAEQGAVLYHVDDSPLLAYLGVEATEPRFRPTRFDGELARARLAEVAADPDARRRSRVAVLLGNARNDQTLTATHTLWAMLGVLPEGHVQRPHRHQSIALDLIVQCDPGCYTLVGPEIRRDGTIVDPVRVDWEPGGAFVTPPGLWHSHHNESGSAANLLPIQDAGLHTYLRTLDIRFTSS
jgi:gentisate 1,2-dioxygenase